ncbi:MAG: zinc ribbon domain-containing protein [Chloroflexota bacterium]
MNRNNRVSTPFIFGKFFGVKIAPVLLLALLVAPLQNVQAQNEVTLEVLEVNLWPEYDRPEMLVILQVTLPADAVLPFELTLRIPAAAGEPFAVTVRESDGELYETEYERTVSDEWAFITFTATTPEAHLEYYDPSLTILGTERRYVFQWSGDYAVQVMNVHVQEPVGARDMHISPSLSTVTEGFNSLIYYSGMIGSLNAGDTFLLTLDYQKETETLSIEQLPTDTSISLGTLLGENTKKILLWGLVVLGVVFTAGGVWWFRKSTRVSAPQKKRHRTQRTKTEERIQIDSGPPREGTLYCHMCGKQAIAGDRFCRACGTQLRINT